MMGHVIKSGNVTVKKPFSVREFNDDNGWETIDIKPGEYEFRVLDVRGWKPRQLKVDGEWIDVMDSCVDLEEYLSAIEETTGVGNIAPTVDYMGHVQPVYLPGMEPVYSDEITDKPDDKKDKEKDKEDTSWTSPIGRLIAGESVRKVIGEQVGLFETGPKDSKEKDPSLLKNLDAFKKIHNVKGILDYPGTLVVRTAYPHNNTFGMRLEDPELTEYFGPISRDNFSNPGIIVEIILDPHEEDYQEYIDKLDHDFYGFMENPDWYHLKDYFKKDIPAIPILRQCTVRQR